MIESSKKSRKKIGQKAMNNFTKNLNSVLLKSKKLSSYKSKAINRSIITKPHNIYRYRIMSTVFNKDENVYYPYYVPNICPNLIIDLKPKQSIIVSDDLIKYYNENVKYENIINKSMTNSGFFSNPNPKVKLIKLSKLKNKSSKENNSICLKTKMPGIIEILNINPNKTYIINPLNIVAYSSNLKFSIQKKGGFLNNILNMVEVKSNDKKGVIFLVCYGGVNTDVSKLITANNKFFISLGQLVAYENNIKIDTIRKILPYPKNVPGLLNKPDKEGIPLNYILSLKGKGNIYYQNLDYFLYAFNQLNIFDEQFLKSPKISQKEKKFSIDLKKYSHGVERFLMNNLDKEKINKKLQPTDVRYAPFSKQHYEYIQYYVLAPGKLKDILFRAVVMKYSPILSKTDEYYISFISKNTSNKIITGNSFTMDILFNVKAYYNPFTGAYDNEINNVIFDDTGNHIAVFLTNKKNNVPYDCYLYKLKYIGVKKMKTNYENGVREILEVNEILNKTSNIKFSNIETSLMNKINSIKDRQHYYD